jgi:hypothetical protein
MAVKLGERNGKRVADVARPVSVRAAPPVRRRSWPLVAAGVLAMAFGALAFGLARSSIDHRVAVLVLVQNVTAGQQLTSSDLGVVEVSASSRLSVVPASEEPSMIGRTVATNLVVGGLLVPAELGSPVAVKSGDGVVAVDLHQGAVPSSLQPGSSVLVVDTAAGAGSGGRVIGQATVLSISGPDPAGGMSLSLVSSVGVAPSIAAASAAGNVSVVVLAS